MRPTKAILIAPGLLVALLISAADTSAAQTPPATQSSPEPAPTLKVYSRETVVDTTVTDKKGDPIHGLLKPDFTLKEDNKPQPIRGFHEYATQPIAPLPKLPPNVYTNLQPPAPTSAINILWLDFTNLAPVLSVSCCDLIGKPFMGPQNLAAAMGVQRHVKQDAMQYLKEMPPGTRVAVFGTTYPGTLHLLQGITSDPALLSAAIDRMDPNTDGKVELDKGGNISQATWCPQQDQRNRATLEALNQMAADMAAINGRKNLIWFTHGIPTITDPAQRPSCLSDYSPGLRKAYGLLTAAQVTVYPVGASGVPVAAPPDDWLSMEAVAEATGGAAFYNNNDLAAQISKAIANGSDYYTLTYVPPGTEYDGRHHTINLKLNLDPAPPGLHLTYRDEYYAEDPTKMAPTPGLTRRMTLASTAPAPKPGDKTFMGRSMPTSTDLLFDVQVEPTTEPPKPTDPPIMGALDPKLAALSSKKLKRYSFEYVLPARQIAFVTTPAGTRKGSLEFDIAAYDAEDKLVTSLSQTINLPITEAQYQQLLKGPFRFFQQLDLPPGPLFLRIGVLDATSNKAGTLEIPLTIQKK
jgi:VWFA-related protein